VLREESPPVPGVMAIALDSIESHFGKQLRAALDAAALAASPAGNVARR